MPSEEVIYFGTFGPRAAGKTVALAAMAYIGGDAEETISLEAASNFTIQYLRTPCKQLSEGGYPSFTPPEDPKPLEFLAEITDGQGRTRRIRLRCIDFAGELTDPIWSAGPAEFKKAVATWFEQCNIIFLFIDSTSTDHEVRNAINKLLQELAQQPTRHGTTRRVVYLMMTKADKHPGVTSQNLTEEHVIDRALKSHPVYRQVYKKLIQNESAVWGVHLVSAVGWGFDTVSEPAKRKVEPANLFEPLRDAIIEAHNVKREGHRELWDKLQKSWGGPPGLFTSCTQRLRELDAFVKDTNVREGTVRGEIARARQGLVRMRRVQRWIQGLTVLLVVIGVSASFWMRGQMSQTVAYDQYDLLVQEKPGGAGAAERVALFNEKIAPRQSEWFWGLSSRRDKAAAQHAKDLAAVAGQDAESAWADLTRTDANLREGHLHPRRHYLVLEYEKKHGKSASQEVRQQIEALKKETKSAYDADRKARTQADRYPLRTLEDFGRKAEGLRQYALRFDALEPEDARAAAEVVLQQERTIRHQDELAFQAAFNMPSSTSTENNARAVALRQYCERPYVLRKAEAQALQDAVNKRGRDLADYETIVQAGNTARSAVEIERVSVLVQGYLSTNQHDKLMADAVRAYATRIDTFKEPRKVDVFLKSVSMPKDFISGTLFGNPVPQVTLTVNDKAYSWTGTATALSGDAYTASPNALMGSFPIEFGVPQSLSVLAKVKRDVFSEEKAEVEVADERWIGQFLNTRVLARSGKHQIPVVLECPEAVFPTLKARFPSR